MRILYAGTPELAVPTLTALAASRHTVVAVLSAPDRPRGRTRAPEPSPVKRAAQELGLPVLEPETLRTEARSAVSAYEPELLACFAYGKIFGPRFLALFSKGSLNVHPSLLPRYRGPAPIPAAIRNRDEETGISIQLLAREIDAGDLVVQERIPLSGRETTESLTGLVAERAAPLLLKAVDAIAEGTATYARQEHEKASYTQLLKKEDGTIDWTRPAEEIDAQIRALKPWPRARTTFRGEPLTIHTAEPVWERVSDGQATEPGRIVGVDRSRGILVETGVGLLALQELQLPTKKPVDWKSFINGSGPCEGEVLGGT